MLKKIILKPVAAVLGTTFAVALAASPIANAADNPFSLTEISSGYMVADQAEGKCGEGKCGGESPTKRKRVLRNPAKGNVARESAVARSPTKRRREV